MSPAEKARADADDTAAPESLPALPTLEQLRCRIERLRGRAERAAAKDKSYHEGCLRDLAAAEAELARREAAR